MDANKPDDATEAPDPYAGQLPRGSTVGRYLVTALIGKGGMGEVYAAYDPELDAGSRSSCFVHSPPGAPIPPRDARACCARRRPSRACRTPTSW